eukprot:7072774-Pyramimonas_sp.AAC.2
MRGRCGLHLLIDVIQHAPLSGGRKKREKRPRAHERAPKRAPGRPRKAPTRPKTPPRRRTQARRCSPREAI